MDSRSVCTRTRLKSQPNRDLKRPQRLKGAPQETIKIEIELLDLINQIQKLIDEVKVAGPNPEAIAALSLPPLLNDELNGFFKRYSISPSTVDALVQLWRTVRSN